MLKVPAREGDYCFFELARWRAAAASDNSSATRNRCSGVSRRASSIFFCASMSPSLLGRREAFRPGNEDVDFGFIVPSYMKTTCPSPFRQPCLLPFHIHLSPNQGVRGWAFLHASSDVLILFASLPLVRKLLRNKRVTGLSFTARVQRGPSEAARCASKKENQLPATAFCARPSIPSPPSLCAAPRPWLALAPSRRQGAASETLRQKASCAPHLF